MMKRLIRGCAFSLYVWSVPANAGTCVGPAFDQPFPEATAVETRHADVPSPAFPGVWQEGIVGGYFYQIFANGEAIVAERRVDPTWTITVSCQDQTCEQTVEGVPEESGARVSDAFEVCLLGGDVTAALAPPKAETPKPEAPEPAAQEDPVPSHTPSDLDVLPVEPQLVAELEAPEVEAAPCGLAALPEGGEGVTLQRLLVMAGGDPGPIDGIAGVRTRRAMADVLGAASVGMDAREAITQLDALLCR